MRYWIATPEGEHEIEVTAHPDGRYSASAVGARNRPPSVHVLRERPPIAVAIDGHVYRVALQPAEVRCRDRRQALVLTGERERLRARAASGASAGRTSSAALRAPLPGRIVRVLVASGALVQKGAPLVVIEAMKMENELRAERDARVGAIRVQAGDAVEHGTVLLELTVE